MPAPGRGVDLVGSVQVRRERLARFKVPRYFEIVDELPHTPTGRLAKHQLAVGPNELGELDMERREAASAGALGPPATSRPPAPSEYLSTWIGSSTPDRITVAGRDLAARRHGSAQP